MKRLTIIICILLLALGVRLLFLFAGGITLDSDEAIVGLMARHMLEGREWPIFYYGQHYMGSLEPTLIAVVFKFFGETEWTLKIVPLIFSLVFVYQVFLLAERLGTTKTGYIAALLSAIPPVGFVEWSTKARGGFIELVVLGTGALLITISILRDKRPRLGSLSLLAFVLGIAWWVNNQAIFYIVAIGLFLVVPLFQRLGAKAFFKEGFVASFFFFIGGAPFWYYNLFIHPRFQTFQQLGGGASSPKNVLEHFVGFFSEALPILIGARRFWSRADLFPYSSFVGYSALVFTLIGFTLVSIRHKRSGRNGAGLLMIFMIVTPTIFAFSAFGWLTSAPRYLLPLYSVWFVCAALTSEIKFGTIAPAVILFLSICSNYLGGVSIPGQPYVVNGQRVSADQTDLNQWLLSRHFSHVYTNYWIGYRIAFETEEQIKFSIYSEPYTFRIPSYENIGEEYLETAPFVLVPSQVEEVAAALEELSIQYELYTASGYVILVPTIVPQLEQSGHETPLEITAASSRVEWARKLVDNNRGTRWGSGAHQSPGMFLEAHFKERSEVSRIEIDEGFWITDSARHLSLQLVDGDHRCLVYEGSTLPLHNFYGPRVQFKVPESLAGTQETFATGVRLEQYGSHPVLDWSVAEINVFSK